MARHAQDFGDCPAFPMEMFAPAVKVPSRRSSAMRLPHASTTAMTPPGALTSWAFALAAMITRSAPSSVTVFFSAVCPEHGRTGKQPQGE